jgi:hypothetical protein
VAQSVPVVIRGVDFLGQPFEERTSTLSFNLHGCRYASRYHLPKNSWVTLETARGSESRNVRARVAWIERPHSLREFFQVSVELEMPVNLWAYEPAPSDWQLTERSSAHRTAVEAQSQTAAHEPEAAPAADTVPMSEDTPMSTPAHISPESEVPSETPSSASVSADNPRSREWSAELEGRVRQSIDEAAADAAEQIRKAAEEKRAWISEQAFRSWKEEFEGAQRAAREQFAAQQDELVQQLKAEFEGGLVQTRRLMAEVERHAGVLRAETGAASEAASRVATARLELEAIQAARSSYDAEAPASEWTEEWAARWREILKSEMAAAGTEWEELLQSSVDAGVRRIAEQLSEQIQHISGHEESRFSERVRELRQPLADTLTEAHETLSTIRGALSDELARAHASLAEIENSVSRSRDVSARLDARASDSLNELDRRLEMILDAQTKEIGERAETASRAAVEKVGAALETMKQKILESTLDEAEAKLALHLDRVPQALRELSSREVRIEEGLRLFRERLRQVAETSQCDFASQVDAAVGQVQTEFECARQGALKKWNEELDAAGVRASHAAADAIGKASDGFEHEARTRLQTLLEQTVTAAATGLETNTTEAKQKFADELHSESSARLDHIRADMDRAASDLTVQARTEIEKAAEISAAAFGQVLRGISDQETDCFAARTQEVTQGRAQELEHCADQVLRKFEAGAECSLARLRAEFAAQLDAGIAEGRSALTAELSSVLAGYRSELDAHHKDWGDRLDRISSEAEARFQERLDTASDSWVVSSVRRLNEHSQNGIESLMRSADQALQDSCAAIFDGIAEALRHRVDATTALPSAAQQAAVSLPADESQTNP